MISWVRFRVGRNLAFVLSLACLAQPTIQGHDRAPSQVAAGIEVFQQYRRGEFEIARAALLRNRDLNTSVRVFRSGADAWLKGQQGEERTRRLTVVAALTLELVSRGVESTIYDYETVQPLIEGMCKLFSPEASSEEERLYDLGVIALLQATRDTLTLFNNGLNTKSSHLHHATLRFPQEPRFRLAWATAPTAVHAISRQPLSPGYLARYGVVDPDPPRSAETLDAVGNALMALGSDPVVGLEARLRRGVLLMARDQHQLAVGDLLAAARSAEAYVRYNAVMMLGVAAERDDRLEAASLRYREAFDIIPASSAALAGAAALARLGRGDEAEQVMVRWTAGGQRSDPWREYAYRDYRLFPSHLSRLRALVQQ